MPNRILRDGFVDSEAVNALSDWAHRVYSNLLVKCDDAGRFDGRLEIIRSHLFPLGTTRRLEDFGKAVAELDGLKLVVPYTWSDKAFLQLTKWQRCGNAETSRYPWRDGGHHIDYVLQETRDGRKAFVTTSLPDGVKTPSPPHRQGKTSESNTETETETETETSTPRTAKGVDIPEPLRTSDFITAWHEWEEHLRKKGVRGTDIADRKQLKQCVGWGPILSIRCIDHSIASRYQGLFAPRDNHDAAPHGRSHQHSRSAARAGNREDN